MRNRLILILTILVLVVGGMICFNLYVDNHQTEMENNNPFFNNLNSNDDFSNNGSTNTSSTTEIITISSDETAKKTNNYNEVDFEYSEETTITLNGDSVSVNGTNVKVEGNEITIVGAGTYRVTGTLDDGRIIINAPSENVKIILDNASIKCSYSSPLYIYKSKNTMIYLNNESTNYLEDGTDYNYNDDYSSAEDEEPNATLYSKSDLIICGTGTLNIKANNNAITSKDTLIIENATISINATNHGINGKDSNTIKNATIQIVSGGDGIRSTNDTDTTLGWVRLENTNIKISSKEDAIQGQTDVIIDGGKIDINSDSKGIKAESNIVLNGNTEYIITSQDDAIHANGSVEINNGDFKINSNDDGIHADKTLTINNGNIIVEKSYEGLEAENIVVNDGNIDITSQDDGININGGNDGSGFGGMGDFGGRINTTNNVEFTRSKDDSGRMRKQTEVGEKMPPQDMGNFIGNSSSAGKLVINGGTIKVNANGDGLDSNGSIEMNGGHVIVNGPTTNGNGAIDYNNSFTITKGTLIAIGSSGMAQGVKTTEEQGSVVSTINGQQSVGTKIELKDSNGNTILETTSEKTFNHLVFTSADVKPNEEYGIYLNGNLSSKVTASSDTSSSGFGGFGGGMRR